MGAVVVVVRARRDQFDGVGAEDDEVANVLFPHRRGPGVVGVGLGAVAELMAADGNLRRGDDAQAVVEIEPLAGHVQFAQKVSGSKEHAAIVVAADDGERRFAGAGGKEGEAFGGAAGEAFERGGGQHSLQIFEAAENDGGARGGERGNDRQSKLRAFLDFTGEHEGGLFARRAGAA